MNKRLAMANVAALVVALAGVACSSGKQATSYASAQQLVAGLDRGGAGCTGLQVAAPGTVGTKQITSSQQVGHHADLVHQAGSCSLGSKTLQVFTFSSKDDRDKWLAFGTIAAPAVVFGPNWAVLAPDGDSASKVEGAIGGTVKSRSG
jgi:hypothetical protein